MINPIKWYTISDLMELADQGIFPIETRQRILDQIELGNLKAVDFGKKEKPHWKIRGENVLAFFETGAVEKKVIQNQYGNRSRDKEKDEKSLPKAKGKVSKVRNKD